MLGRERNVHRSLGGGIGIPCHGHFELGDCGRILSVDTLGGLQFCLGIGGLGLGSFDRGGRHLDGCLQFGDALLRRGELGIQLIKGILIRPQVVFVQRCAFRYQLVLRYVDLGDEFFGTRCGKQWDDVALDRHLARHRRRKLPGSSHATQDQDAQHSKDRDRGRCHLDLDKLVSQYDDADIAEDDDRKHEIWVLPPVRRWVSMIKLG